MSMNFDSLVKVTMEDIFSFMHDLDILEKGVQEEMGMVREYKDMERELEEMKWLSEGMAKDNGIALSATKVNQCTDLSLICRPITFDVVFGDKVIYACNELDNAYTIYDIIRSDIKGKVWHGK